MQRLTLRRHRPGGDGGVMAVLVAILVSAVLLGLGAFVTDVGLWYSERAQLQNGADAAALAVAQTCIRGQCDTGLSGNHAAPRFANANANDSLSSIDFICGNGPGLSPCVSSTCPLGIGNFVTVHTLTLERDGSHLLPPMFGRALVGADYDGQTIGACATVNWFGAGRGLGLALTVSLCAWQKATSNGTVFAPQPPYATWPPSAVPRYVGTPPAPGVAGGEQTLMFHGTDNDCAGNLGSGWQLPGGFGYLPEDHSGVCSTTISVDDTYADQPGNSVSAECAQALTESRNNHTISYIPVYDGIQGTGAGGIYHLAGFAAFVLTGGYLNGQTGGFKMPSTISGQNYCKGNDRCIYGMFTQGLVPSSSRMITGGLPGGYTTAITA